MTRLDEDDFHPIRDGLWTRDPEELARRRQQFGAHIARHAQHFEALNADQMRRDKLREWVWPVAKVIAVAAGATALAWWGMDCVAVRAAAAVADPFANSPW